MQDRRKQHSTRVFRTQTDDRHLYVAQAIQVARICPTLPTHKLKETNFDGGQPKCPTKRLPEPNGTQTEAEDDVRECDEARRVLPYGPDQSLAAATTSGHFQGRQTQETKRTPQDPRQALEGDSRSVRQKA